MRAANVCLMGLMLTSFNIYAEETEGIDWSGLHLGGFLALSNIENAYLTDNTATKEVFDQSKSKQAYGFDIGYDTQLNHWIIGLDLNYLSTANDDYSSSVAKSHANRLRESKVDNILMLTPKIGYSFDRWVIYAKGGYALADFKYKGWNTYANEATSSLSKTLNGWTVGCGADYKLIEHVNLGVEFNHVQLDSNYVEITPSYSPIFLREYYSRGQLDYIKTDIDVLMFKVNYQL
jgi:outer membrane immunogenic protein